MDFNCFVDFLDKYSFLIALISFIVALAVLEWELFKTKAREYLWSYEAEFRSLMKQNKSNVIEWITDNWYSYLPVHIKVFLTKSLFKQALEIVYDEIYGYVLNVSNKAQKNKSNES